MNNNEKVAEKKIRVGIVGRGFIVDEFVKATSDFSEIKRTSLCSRKEETGREFAEKYGIERVFTSIEDMISSNEIDAVYIASPNSLHCGQSIKFLESKIAVLCEKPLGSNIREVELMKETAVRNKTLLMEAIKAAYMPSYEWIKQELHTIGPVRGIFANFCQYSSRYNDYKKGIIQNTFKKELSNGSTMDIGLYPVYFVVGLFGEPEKVDANGHILSTGVDGAGIMMLKYPEFTAVINHSKIANSYIPSEIIGENGTITIGKISTLDKIKFNYNDGTSKEYEPDEKSKMYFEIEEFIKMYKNNKYESDKNNHNNSLKVISVLEKARKCIDVVFPCDLQDTELNHKDELQIAREKIDNVDPQIVQLLEDRMGAVSQVAAYKLKNSVGVLDSKREEQVFENIRRAVKNPEYEETIVKTFDDIMKRSKEFQVEKNKK